MKCILMLLFIFNFFYLVGQDNNLQRQKKYFEGQLKEWTNSFTNFKLSDFTIADTLHFDNAQKLDFKQYKTFLSTYKPMVTYSMDYSQFIDIYSYQLQIEKKGNYYYANPEIDQAIYLCAPKRKYWNQIYFGTSSQWIDEIIWVSKTKFILLGITKSEDDKKMPLLLIGNTNTQTLHRYLTKNMTCFQQHGGYMSPKLKKMKIRGL